jgi:hypothetical protein
MDTPNLILFIKECNPNKDNITNAPTIQNTRIRSQHILTKQEPTSQPSPFINCNDYGKIQK